MNATTTAALNDIFDSLMAQRDALKGIDITDITPDEKAALDSLYSKVNDAIRIIDRTLPMPASTIEGPAPQPQPTDHELDAYLTDEKW